MKSAIVVTGTDTDVGKTVFAAALVAALDGYYWKPVQAGFDGETDAEIVRRLSGLPAERVLPEVYRLTTAASPHLAAERDGVEIDFEGLANAPVFAQDRAVVIEGAGGLLVPLTRNLLADRAVRALGCAGRARRFDPARYDQPQPALRRSAEATPDPTARHRLRR